MTAAVDRPLSARKHGLPGLMIVFSGIDGSGKTSLLMLTREWLRHEHGMESSLVATPSPAVRRHPLFRRLMYDSDDQARASVDPFAVNLLVLSDRRQTYVGEISPRLADGEIVLCDRYVYCSVIDAVSRDLPEQDCVGMLAAQFPEPDIVIVTEIDVSTALDRIRAREGEREMFVDEARLEREADATRRLALANSFTLIRTDADAATTFKTHLVPHLDNALQKRRQNVRAPV